jgi:predicted phage terminase large subunit-like protein
VIIGQRMHREDPHGAAVARDPKGWTCVSLPALLGETDDRCAIRDRHGNVLWQDERQVGEPLMPLLGVDAVAQLQRELGSATFAAMYQQRPHDDSASMFPRAWLTRRWVALPERFDRVAISLDASFKESKSSDYAVIQTWGRVGADRVLFSQWRRQAGFADTLAALKEAARAYPSAKIVVELGANGVAIVDQIRREGFSQVIGVKPDGGKVARAASVQAIVESGAVVLPEHAPWLDAWLDEVTAFPNGKHDDQVDAMVYALRELVPGRRDTPLLAAGGGSACIERGTGMVLGGSTMFGGASSLNDGYPSGASLWADREENRR